MSIKVCCTVNEVKAAIQRFIVKNGNVRFVTASQQKAYGASEDYLLQIVRSKQRIQWSSPPNIPFTGTPFVHVGRKSFDCEQGKKRIYNTKISACNDVDASGNPVPYICKRRNTKKIGCPASISVVQVAEFPEHSIVHDTRRKRNLAASAIMSSFEKGEDIQICYKFFVLFPDKNSHVGHSITQPGLIRSSASKRTSDESERCSQDNNHSSEFEYHVWFDDGENSRRCNYAQCAEVEKPDVVVERPVPAIKTKKVRSVPGKPLCGRREVAKMQKQCSLTAELICDMIRDVDSVSMLKDIHEQLLRTAVHIRSDADSEPNASELRGHGSKRRSSNATGSTPSKWKRKQAASSPLKNPDSSRHTTDAWSENDEESFSSGYSLVARDTRSWFVTP